MNGLQATDIRTKHVDPGTGLGDVWIYKQFVIFQLTGIVVLMWWSDSVSSHQARPLSPDG